MLATFTRLWPYRKVWPSGAAESTWLAATEPAAPFAFTTMKSAPVIFLANSANTRAERSVLPPAPAGTTMETVVLGVQSDACASVSAAAAGAPVWAAVVSAAAAAVVFEVPPPHAVMLSAIAAAIIPANHLFFISYYSPFLMTHPGLLFS